MTDGDLDWRRIFIKHHPLGMWHALNYLKSVSTIRDPYEVARDVVQDAWITMWRKRYFSKALFITVIHALCSNAARSYRPIELRKVSDGRQRRTTNSFPVQIFGGLIGEVTTEEEIEAPSCGDE